MATNCKESTEPLISPSLLLRIPEKLSKEAHKQFALGLGEWTESNSDGEKENVEPLERVPKKLKLSKTKAAPENRWRFVDVLQVVPSYFKKLFSKGVDINLCRVCVTTSNSWQCHGY